MSLLWEHIDIFLGRLRGVQRLYYYSGSGDTAYYGLFLYDYVYFFDKWTLTKQEPKAEEGVGE